EDLVRGQGRLPLEPGIEPGIGADIGGNGRRRQAALGENDVGAGDEIVAGNENETARKLGAQDVEDAVPIGPAEGQIIDAADQTILRIPHGKLLVRRAVLYTYGSNRCLP